MEHSIGVELVLAAIKTCAGFYGIRPAIQLIGYLTILIEMTLLEPLPLSLVARLAEIAAKNANPKFEKN